jgi:hypothetical protein
MKIASNIFLTGILATLLFIGCKSGPNSPDQNTGLNDQLSYETVDSDLAFMKSGGMSVDSAAGVFSIGWNEIFRPFMDSSQVKGMAFAVAFGDENIDLQHFRKHGLDMGDITINYSGNQVEMHKHIHPTRGIAYSLFERPFGRCASENLLEFIPNTEYQFEVTGAEDFDPITITLLSPAALMKITSPEFGQIINPAEDLTITWEGGSEGKVGIRLMPDLKPHRGPGGEPGRRQGDPQPPMHRIIFIILDTNTGNYTFTSGQIQELITGLQVHGLRAEVSQMDFGEVQHENGTLQTAMRNGNSVMLRIQ